MFAKFNQTEGRFAFSETDNGGVPITQDAYEALFVAQAAGNQIVPDANGGPVAATPVAQVVVPSVVSRFQARAALLGAGMLDQVETIMADPNTPAIQKLAWTDAQEFRRDSPTVTALAGVLGLNDAALDNLFITASGITA